MTTRHFSHGMRTGTDSFVNNNGIYLEFFHLPTKKIVRFKAFITDYSEAYNVNFNEQDVYGRMDPIATYQGTKRKINLSWMTVAESHAEAYENWKNVQEYIKMMYPAYKKFVFDQKDAGRFSATTLAAPPLLKMKFMNLIADSSTTTLEKKSVASNKSVNLNNSIIKKQLVEYSAGNVQDNGLLVVPGSLNVNPNFVDRAGILSGGKKIDDTYGRPLVRNVEFEDYISSDKFFIPIEVTLSSEFTVLHQHDLGTEKVINKGSIISNNAKAAKLKNQTTKANNKVQFEKNLNASSKRLKHYKKKATKVKQVNNKKIQKIKSINNNIVKKGPVREKEGFNSFPHGIKK